MRHHCKTSLRLLCYNSLANPSFYKHRLLSFCGTLVSRRAQIVALGDLQLPRISDLQLLLINCVGGQGRWTFERSAVLGGITRPCSQAAGEKKNLGRAANGRLATIPELQKKNPDARIFWWRRQDCPTSRTSPWPPLQGGQSWRSKSKLESRDGDGQEKCTDDRLK